jgi:hypothetical protein
VCGAISPNGAIFIVEVVPIFSDTSSWRGHHGSTTSETDRLADVIPSDRDVAPKRFRDLIQWGTVARLIVAVVVGSAVGAVNEWSVPHLPASLEPLSNSAAPWIIVACVLALTARRLGEALVLSVVSLLALVLGFYVAQAHRGWAVSLNQVAFWIVASVALGPLVGLAVSWLRRAVPIGAALGAGELGGLLVGEAVHGLTSLRFSTPARYWEVQFALGVGLAIGLTLWRSRRRPLVSLALASATCIIVSLSTFAIYQV